MKLVPLDEPNFKGCLYCRRRGCRRSRPLCRERRLEKPNQRKCECGGGYHFPHRAGSPLCEKNPKGSEAIWAELDKPRRKAG